MIRKMQEVRISLLNDKIFSMPPKEVASDFCAGRVNPAPASRPSACPPRKATPHVNVCKPASFYWHVFYIFALAYNICHAYNRVANHNLVRFLKRDSHFAGRDRRTHRCMNVVVYFLLYLFLAIVIAVLHVTTRPKFGMRLTGCEP